MTILVLLFYMLMVGMTPSVVRACIMQIFLQLAPLFRRDGDSLTSLSAALLAILLCSPMAAQSISLQLSFAATLGILLLSGRMYRRAADAIHRKFEKNSGLCGALCFVAANVTVSLGALVFTIPLSAAYFGVLSVVSPLSNLLVVPVAGWNFMAAFVTVLVGFVWLPAAKLLGLAALGLTKYMLLAARLLARLPGHALYLNNKYLIAWLVFVYVLFTAAALLRGPVKRRYLLPSVLAVCTLVLSVWLGTLAYRTDTLAAVAVDVGQGECVLLTSQGDTALVDCGSSNNYINAGSRAIAQLGTMGAHRLKARRADALPRRPHERARAAARARGGGAAVPAVARGRVRREGQNLRHRRAEGNRDGLCRGRGEPDARRRDAAGLSARGEEEPERGGADGPVLGGELRCARDGRHARKYREEAHRGL